MNNKELSKLRFWDTLDAALMENRYSGERRESLYPSEASTVYIDPKTKKASVVGGCTRKSWYRLMKFKESDPPTVKSEYIFEMGRTIERMITELSKLSGIYDNNSVKFWDRSSSVSGEIDITLKHYVNDEKKYVFVECKSTWGGQLRNGFESGKAKFLFDHYEGRGKTKTFIKGKPKYEHVLQLVTYLFTHKDDPDLLGGKLVYLLRDNMNRTEFDVVLVETDKGHRVMVNGILDGGFYVENIYERYAALANKVNEDIKLMRAGIKKEELIPPVRDYSLEYTDEEIEEMYKNKEISTMKYNNWKAGKTKLGDWNCSYCSMKSLCYNKQQSSLVPAEVEEEEELVEED